MEIERRRREDDWTERLTRLEEKLTSSDTRNEEHYRFILQEIKYLREGQDTINQMLSNGIKAKVETLIEEMDEMKNAEILEFVKTLKEKMVERKSDIRSLALIFASEIVKFALAILAALYVAHGAGITR